MEDNKTIAKMLNEVLATGSVHPNCSYIAKPNIPKPSRRLDFDQNVNFPHKEPHRAVAKLLGDDHARPDYVSTSCLSTRFHLLFLLHPVIYFFP